MRTGEGAWAAGWCWGSEPPLPWPLCFWVPQYLLGIFSGSSLTWKPKGLPGRKIIPFSALKQFTRVLLSVFFVSLYGVSSPWIAPCVVVTEEDLESSAMIGFTGQKIKMSGACMETLTLSVEKLAMLPVMVLNS